MKYRKKPVVIEAIQFTGDNAGEVIVWRNEDESRIHTWVVEDDSMLIPTSEGTMRATKGDWIIRGVKGEYYPCKPDIFEATYEPA